MSKSIQFIFGVHNHQPVGNFDYIFEDAYQKSYEPFLQIVERHPKISVSLHYSGTLFDWLEKHHPDFMDRLRDLVNRKNVELLSGAYYEPVLAAIPEEDRIGQILKMNQYLRNHFGFEAKGMWLAERIWEPHLPQSIEQGNIRYTAIDDYHFQSSGIREFPVKGYYNTEDDGHTVGIFPISKKLRDMIPYNTPQQVIDYLKTQVSDNNQHMMMMMDDGEKFGIYPDTFSKVYDEGWLDTFFTLMEKNSDWLKTTTLKNYWEQYMPQGLAYFGSGGHFDMAEWSLDPLVQEKYTRYIKEIEDSGRMEELRPFIRGGYWRNFMTKYMETNWLQKRMQQISRKLRLLESQAPRRESLRKIRETLWEGMCNNAYWYGVYGGLYLPHLRRAVWKNLIKAEKKIDERLYNLDENFLMREESDINRNGLSEVKVSTKDYNAVFSVKSAGALVEFDFRPSGVNLCDTIRRIPEKYHTLIRTGKDSTIQKYIHIKDGEIPFSVDDLIYDTVPRYSLLEKYFDIDIDVHKVYRNLYEDASDFVNQAVDTCHNNGENLISFLREGWINWQRVRLRKDVYLLSDGFKVEYTLTNIGMGKSKFAFGPEFNINLSAGPDDEKSFSASTPLADTSVKAMGDTEGVETFSVINRHDKYKLNLNFSEPVRVFTYPVETIVLAQTGFEKIYQSSAILPIWNLELEAGKTLQFSMNYHIEKLN